MQAGSWVATQIGNTSRQSVVPTVSRGGTANRIGWYRRQDSWRGHPGRG